MKLKDVLLSAGIVVAIFVGINFPVNGTTIVEKTIEQVGAVAGPDVSFPMFFHEGITTGGYLATSSTASTYTTRVSDFRNLKNVLAWTPNVNTTVTLASTSLYQIVPAVGDAKEVYLLNASTTAAASMTLAADTGVDLQFAEATGGDLVLTGLDWAKLTIIRKSSTVVTVIFDEMTEAD